jgi:hypothetical protein
VSCAVTSSAQAGDSRRDLLVECVDLVAYGRFVTDMNCGGAADVDCSDPRIDEYFQSRQWERQWGNGSRSSGNISATTCSASAQFIAFAESQISNAAFECPRLSQCRITCDGPDPDVLQSASHQCSCMAEWAIHASVLKSILVLVVYIILNMSR